MKQIARKELFKTQPHGEHIITEVENIGLEDEILGANLYNIRSSGGSDLTFTGEEMDSLARQWLAHSAIHDGYTKAELEAAFKKVQNAEHWKNPIDAFIQIDEVNITAKAIQFFTATTAQFFRVTTAGGKLKMRVTAPGYYAGPAN
jgi:hypothetical protein